MLDIQKKLQLPCATSIAFDVFVNLMPDWWPVETHSLSAKHGEVPLSLSVTTGRFGRITEIDHEGNAHIWGSFQQYYKPHQLAINWHVGVGVDRATCIKIGFNLRTGSSTEVTLVHSGWSTFGEDAASMRAQYDIGWDHVLGTCYKNACLKAIHAPAAVIDHPLRSMKQSANVEAISDWDIDEAIRRAL